MLKFLAHSCFRTGSRFAYKHRFYSTAANSKLRIVFFGTDDFATTHLKALVEENEKPDSFIDSIDLVCPPDRRTGRKLEKITPSETKGLANLKNLKFFHTPEGVKSLSDWHIPSTTDYDVGVVVSFGYFIPPHIIASFKYGAVNVHPSLLPKYRGAAPIQHAIMYGDATTGVSIQELDDREFDAGRILAQKSVSLERVYYSELKQRLAHLGSSMLVDTLRHLQERKQQATSQDATQATKAPKIKKEWSVLDFEHMYAWQAEQLNRAIGEQYPLRTTFQNKKNKEITVQLLDLTLVEGNRHGNEPGSFIYDEASQSMHIVFGDHNILACKKFKVENKGTISAHDFANGYQMKGKFESNNDSSVIASNLKKRQKMKRFVQ